MLNRLKKTKINTVKKRISKFSNYNVPYIYQIRAEQNIEVKSEKVAKVVGKSINYRPLEIKSKRANKIEEESKISMYKQTVPQYNIIKKLVDNKNDNIKIETIDYKKLDRKIKELDEKRNYHIDLLELDLYCSCIDEFYILKSYMDKE